MQYPPNQSKRLISTTRKRMTTVSYPGADHEIITAERIHGLSMQNRRLDWPDDIFLARHTRVYRLRESAAANWKENSASEVNCAQELVQVVKSPLCRNLYVVVVESSHFWFCLESLLER